MSICLSNTGCVCDQHVSCWFLLFLSHRFQYFKISLYIYIYIIVCEFFLTQPRHPCPYLNDMMPKTRPKIITRYRSPWWRRSGTARAWTSNHGHSASKVRELQQNSLFHFRLKQHQAHLQVGRVWPPHSQGSIKQNQRKQTVQRRHQQTTTVGPTRRRNSLGARDLEGTARFVESASRNWNLHFGSPCVFSCFFPLKVEITKQSPKQSPNKFHLFKTAGFYLSTSPWLR